MVLCQWLYPSDVVVPHHTSHRNAVRFARFAPPSHASSRGSQARFLFPQKPLSVLLAQRRCIHFVHFCEGTSAGLGVLPLVLISSLFYCIILLIPLPRICLICGFDYNITFINCRKISYSFGYTKDFTIIQ